MIRKYSPNSVKNILPYGCRPITIGKINVWGVFVDWVSLPWWSRIKSNILYFPLKNFYSILLSSGIGPKKNFPKFSVFAKTPPKSGFWQCLQKCVVFKGSHFDKKHRTFLHPFFRTIIRHRSSAKISSRWGSGIFSLKISCR